MSDFDNAGNDDRARRILKDAAGKRVIHLGCADAPFTRERLESGTLLHMQLLEVAPHTIGVDINLDAMAMIQERMPEAQFFSPDTIPPLDTLMPDLVVAGEVIEHIVDFVQFGSLLRKVTSTGTQLIVTTPNAYSLKGALRALMGVEQQHPDHTCLFSTETLQVMLKQFGFQLVSKSYYNNPPRSLSSAPLGYTINALLRMMPRASDGLYFVFKRTV